LDNNAFHATFAFIENAWFRRNVLYSRKPMEASGKNTGDQKLSEPAWNAELLKNPHEAKDKRKRVQEMFAAIAPSYDLNNRLHSLWMDQAWRRKAVKLANLRPTDRVVDVACGTGDLTLAFAESLLPLIRERPFPAARILGIDFTYPMLPLAATKWDDHPIVDNEYEDPIDLAKMAGASKFVMFANGDAQHLPLPDQSADVVSIAFGIRNVQEPAKALAEFRRILRPGGRVIILEFSLPTNPILRGLYNFYFRQVLPRTATLISGDKTGAYKYLPESVNTFIGREQMMSMMTTAGFSKVEQFPMTFGVCVCYRGVVA
jgi:demethylmenaquinone methyltransferase/2-methoxy-6-polyprenyl-1,4-benzoquinol methylase